MAPIAHLDDEDDGPLFGPRQALTLVAMAVGVSVVGMLVAHGLRAWRAYDERSDREALEAAMAPGFPRWRALEAQHGFSRAAPAARRPGGSPGADAEGRGHWVEVVPERPLDGRLPTRGAVLEVEAGELRLHETHRALPERLRADSAEEVGWVVFVRLSRLEGAYFYETHPVAIERLEAHLVSVDGVRLARGEAEALPPAFVPREGAFPTDYALPRGLLVRLTRRMVDGADALRSAQTASAQPAR